MLLMVLLVLVLGGRKSTKTKNRVSRYQAHSWWRKYLRLPRDREEEAAGRTGGGVVDGGSGGGAREAGPVGAAGRR